MRLFGGLRARVAILAALIALLATCACAALAALALVSGLRSQREATVSVVAEQVRHRLGRLVQRMAFEVKDYAMWDELYSRMPMPAEEWAQVNMVPGGSAGRLTQSFCLVIDGAISARYRRSASRGPEATQDDPAPPLALIELGMAGMKAGVVAPGGVPALFAVHPIQASDGSGPAHGSLVAISYLTETLHAELVQPGYILELAPIPRSFIQPQVAWREGRVASTIAEPTQDGGGLAITVVEAGAVEEALIWHALWAVIVGGGISAAVAMLIGIAIGWSWMRPFTALAEACSMRITDPSVPLPRIGGLQEAEILRESLDRLAAAERENARRLVDTLDRERTVNAVHHRFLAQLGHEVGDPLHAMVATMQKLAAEGGRLPPEEVALTLERALELEMRLQDTLGLVGPEAAATRSGPSERGVEGYLAVIVELLGPLAASRGGSVIASGSDRVAVRPEMLTPILINLASNALRAGRGICVTISGARRGGGSQWVVDDDGPGIAPDLAARISDACARREVLPGTAGLGLGIAVVLANLRVLEGTIEMVNRPGSGVRFTIDLPPMAGGSGLIKFPPATR